MIRNMTPETAKKALKPRNPEANKRDFGYVALVGGSLPYSGAIRLANLACCALRAGAGVVTVAAPRSVCEKIVPQILESTLCPLSEEGDFFRFDENEFRGLAEKYDVICFGMGIGSVEESAKAVKWLLENYRGILILDADGLNGLAKLISEGASVIDNTWKNLILTPHAKEFERLSGISVDEMKKAPLDAALGLATRLGCIVLLKGHTTYITDGKTRDVYVSETGTPGMATGGSGDVLSGILAALSAANKEDLFLATASAAFINGRAGEIAAKEHGEISMTAGDTARSVERVIRELTLEVDD